jgi:hypothetical protein
MSDTPDLVGFLKNRAVFDPCGRVEDVVGFVVEQPEAIIGGPTAAGGIDNEDIAIAFEDLGSFADGHVDGFPRLIGGSDENAGSTDRAGIFQGSDVDILATVAFARPARPEEVFATAVEVQDSAVDGPTAGLERSAATVFTTRVGTVALNDPHAVVVVIAVVGGVIDEPFAIDEVKFWGPDVVGVFSASGGFPDADTWIHADAGDGTSAADIDMPFVASFCVVVETAVKNHPRVGRMRWQYRVNNVAVLCDYSFRNGAPPDRCPLHEERFP